VLVDVQIRDATETAAADKQLCGCRGRIAGNAYFRHIRICGDRHNGNLITGQTT
jgi:hypothetical protein